MRQANGKSLLFAAGAGGLLLFCLTPFIYMLIVSLYKTPDVFSANLFLQATLSNYIEIFFTPSLHFGRYLLNSLLISNLSAGLCVLVAMLAAYGVTRFPYRRKTLLMMIVLCFSMFPQVSQVGFLYDLESRLGWINSYRGLVLPYVAWVLPLSFWFLASYLSRIPLDLDRAALIDGCSRFSVLIRVILPLSAPGLVSAFLLAFIFAFNEFLFALILTTDFTARTLPVRIAFFEGLHGEIPWGTVMAASAVATAPVVILSVLFQRRIVQGLTRGAVKG